MAFEIIKLTYFHMFRPPFSPTHNMYISLQAMIQESTKCSFAFALTDVSWLSRIFVRDVLSHVTLSHLVVICCTRFASFGTVEPTWEKELTCSKKIFSGEAHPLHRSIPTGQGTFSPDFGFRNLRHYSRTPISERGYYNVFGGTLSLT